MTRRSALFITPYAFFTRATLVTRGVETIFLQDKIQTNDITGRKHIASTIEKIKTKKQFIQVQKALKESATRRDSLQKQTLTILDSLKVMRANIPLFIELRELSVLSERTYRGFDAVNEIRVDAYYEGVLNRKNITVLDRKMAHQKYAKAQRLLDLICNKLKVIDEKRRKLIDDNLELYKASVEMEARAERMHQSTLVEHADVVRLQNLLDTAPKAVLR